MKYFSALAASLALVAALGLTGCGKKAEQPIAASPDAKPGLAVSDGRLVLPAVSGNPAAGYFSLTNGSSSTATLAAVAIDGADKAEMHETMGGTMAPLDKLEIKAGESVTFAPGGKHVMAFGLKPDLRPGTKVEMTLTFGDGDKLSTPLTLEAPGAAGAMSMDHEATH